MDDYLVWEMVKRDMQKRGLPVNPQVEQNMRFVRESQHAARGDFNCNRIGTTIYTGNDHYVAEMCSLQAEKEHLDRMMHPEWYK